jgi:hypothetical protein
MTKTQRTTSGPKESKGKSFLINILTLKSDPIVLTLETRPLVRPPWLRPAIASMFPGPCGCLSLGIRKGVERREKGEGKGMTAAGKRQQLPRMITQGLMAVLIPLFTWARW